jgi:hypothetical protein
MQYDCIIPWSGGVESTALVWWALENEYVPLCYHVNTGWDKWSQTNEHRSVQAMAKILNIECITVGNNIEGVPWRDGSYPEDANRMNFSFWMWWAMIFATYNPSIKEIWYGNNYGMYEVGDGLGDVSSMEFVETVKGCRAIARGLYIDFDIYCPFKASKVEQWNWLPENIQSLVASTDQKPEWLKWQANQ